MAISNVNVTSTLKSISTWNTQSPHVAPLVAICAKFFTKFRENTPEREQKAREFVKKIGAVNRLWLEMICSRGAADALEWFRKELQQATDTANELWLERELDMLDETAGEGDDGAYSDVDRNAIAERLELELERLRLPFMQLYTEATKRSLPYYRAKHGSEWVEYHDLNEAIAARQRELRQYAQEQTAVAAAVLDKFLD